MTNGTSFSSSLTVALEDGTAERMGEGMFIILQKDDHGMMHNVVLDDKDMSTLRSSSALETPLTNGSGDYMGDGLWVISQIDEEHPGVEQRVAVSEGDLELMLAA